MELGTFQVMDKWDLRNEAKILRARFVLAIQTGTNGKETHKARYVISDHRDRMTLMMVRTIVTVQPYQVRLLLRIAAISHFQL